MLDVELCVSVKEESYVLCLLALTYVAPTLDRLCHDINKASLNLTTMKKCKYDTRIRCFFPRCYFVDFKGNVRICKHHPNPSGYIMPRKVSLSVLRSVSN